MLKIAGFAAVVGLALVGGAPRASARSDPAVKAAIERRIAAKEISGAIVLIERGDGKQTLDFAGTTSLGGGAPLTADTVLWIASMTKPIAAAAVLMLVDEGRIGLDDRVSQYIPEFGVVPRVRTPKPGFGYGPSGRPDPKGLPTEYDLAPARRTLTLRDLITMTAGLQTIGVPNHDIAPITPSDTLASWVPRLANVPLDFEPGSRWAYSNATGYEVLARVVEIAAGMPFAEFVQHRLFEPLGMKDTSFGPRADLAARTAPLGNMAANPIMMGRFASASAGLLSTATDYAHFAEMLRDDGVYHGRRLLRAASVAALRSNQIGAAGLAGIGPRDYAGLQNRVAPGLKYGYGVAVVTDAAAAGLSLPTGAYGWDGVGTRRVWIVPASRTLIVILVPDAGETFGPTAGPGAGPTHREIEAIVARTSH